jgi:hypothetical protein
MTRMRKTVRRRPPRLLERQHRYQHGFRPQLEELEDRRVLSSLQLAVINYPTRPLHATVSVTSIPSGPCIPNGPCYPSGPVIPTGPCYPSGPAVVNYPQGPGHGANLHANVSVISYPNGPIIPSSLFPNGPCCPQGPIR